MSGECLPPVAAMAAMRQQKTTGHYRMHKDTGPGECKFSAYLSHILGYVRTHPDIGSQTENHGVPGSNPGPATP